MGFKVFHIPWYVYLILIARAVDDHVMFNVRFTTTIGNTRLTESTKHAMFEQINSTLVKQQAKMRKLLKPKELIFCQRFFDVDDCIIQFHLKRIEPVSDITMIRVWVQMEVFNASFQIIDHPDCELLPFFIPLLKIKTDNPNIVNYGCGTRSNHDFYSLLITQPHHVFCLSEYDSMLNYTWPDSEANVVHSALYPSEKSDVVRYIAKRCLWTDWGVPTVHTISGMSHTCDINGTDMINLVCHPYIIKHYTQNIDGITDEELDRALYNMLASSKKDRESVITLQMSNVIMSFVNRIMSSNRAFNRAVSKQIREAIDNVVKNYRLSEGTFRYNSKEITMVIHDITDVVTTKGVTNFRIGLHHDRPYKNNNNDNDNDDDTTVDILLDRDGLYENDDISIPMKHIIESVNIDKKKIIDRVGLYVLKNDDLFGNPSNNVITKVYSILIPGSEKISLSDNIILSFHLENKTDDGKVLMCMYWDEEGNLGQGHWSFKGCQTYISVDDDGDHVECHCNHFSSFALLAFPITNYHHERRLHWISIIGCTISAMSLILTLVTYLSFKPLISDIPSKILVMICINLLCTNLLFILNVYLVSKTPIDFSYDSEEDATFTCKIVAVFFHYFLLASLSWMGANGYFMFRSTVEVFGLDSMILFKLALFANGLPMFIVLLTSVVHLDKHYGLVKGEICWLKYPAEYLAFTIPVGLITAYNIFIFLVVFKQIHRILITDPASSYITPIIAQLKGGICITFLLGLTWSFAYLALIWEDIILSYLFVTCNAFQGFFLFLFYCVFKEKTRYYWLRWCRRMRKVEVLATTSKTKSVSISGQGMKTEDEVEKKDEEDGEDRPWPQTKLRNAESLELKRNSTTIF